MFKQKVIFLCDIRKESFHGDNEWHGQARFDLIQFTICLHSCFLFIIKTLVGLPRAHEVGGERVFYHAHLKALTDGRTLRKSHSLAALFSGGY